MSQGRGEHEISVKDHTPGGQFYANVAIRQRKRWLELHAVHAATWHVSVMFSIFDPLGHWWTLDGFKFTGKRITISYTCWNRFAGYTPRFSRQVASRPASLVWMFSCRWALYLTLWCNAALPTLAACCRSVLHRTVPLRQARGHRRATSHALSEVR